MSTAAAILCGGRSSRMGRDKATLVVDGDPMARRVAAAAVTAGCGPVFAVGGDAKMLGALGLSVVADLAPGAGPLGGIVTALAAATTEHVLVVACDLPWIDADSIRALVAAIGSHDAAVARSDRLEPLCAVWSVRTSDGVSRRFHDGERAVHRVLADLDVVTVDVDATRLLNVNTPTELAVRPPRPQPSVDARGPA